MKGIGWIERFVGVAIVAVLLASCNRTSAVLGDWSGSVTVGPTSIPLNLHIAQAEKGGGLTGTLESPSQGKASIPLDDVTFEDGTLKFRVKMIGGEYEGKLKEGKELEGQWHQMGASVPLNLTKK
jgi:hypothetical protein